jgi:SulP family sulfate permease
MSLSAKGVGFKLFGGKQAPGDLWGGLAAMLVALPASIAFGVTVYSAIGPEPRGLRRAGRHCRRHRHRPRRLHLWRHRPPDQRALCACRRCALGLRHRTGESGRAIGHHRPADDHARLHRRPDPDPVGFVGVGRLIKYIPYPVVSGYLSGVGLIIIGSQIPRFAGAAAMPTGGT